MHQCVDGGVWKGLMGSTTSELPTQSQTISLVGGAFMSISYLSPPAAGG